MARVEIRSGSASVATKWGWFLLLGIILIGCGAAAVILPVASSFAASVVLGVALAISGIVKIVEALQVAGWAGYAWQMLVGAVEIVGGILIYLNPWAGALAITLLIGLVFLVQGLVQIGLAFRVRPRAGWGWLLLAGLIALCVTAAMVMKLRYTNFYTPGTVGGIALIVAGCAYLAIALTNRRAVQQETLA
jgi:uncharacterized membrane protein HdeD (DUF308 family)